MRSNGQSRRTRVAVIDDDTDLLSLTQGVLDHEERREILERQGIKTNPRPFDLPALLEVIRDAIASRASADRM